MAYSNGYTYRRILTIGASTFGASVPDVPLRVSLSGDYLKEKTYNGRVETGADFRFENAGGSLLSSEIEYYNGASGVLEAWVRTDVNTGSQAISFYYGNPNVSENETDPQEVWEGYAMVAHMNNAGGTIYDSTSNKYHGRKRNSLEPVLGTGRIGYGQEYDGANDFCEVLLGLSYMNGYTIEYWINPKEDVDRMRPFNSTNWATSLINAGATQYLVYLGTGLSLGNPLSFVGGISYDNWHHFTLVNNGTTCSGYSAGVLKTSQTSIGTGKPVGDFYLGGQSTDSDVTYGTIDEFRIYNGSYDANRALASYVAQGTSIYTVGEEVKQVKVQFDNLLYGISALSSGSSYLDSRARIHVEEGYNNTFVSQGYYELESFSKGDRLDSTITAQFVSEHLRGVNMKPPFTHRIRSYEQYYDAFTPLSNTLEKNWSTIGLGTSYGITLTGISAYGELGMFQSDITSTPFQPSINLTALGDVADGRAYFIVQTGVYQGTDKNSWSFFFRWNDNDGYELEFYRDGSVTQDYIRLHRVQARKRTQLVSVRDDTLDQYDNIAINVVFNKSKIKVYRSKNNRIAQILQPNLQLLFDVNDSAFQTGTMAFGSLVGSDGMKSYVRAFQAEKLYSYSTTETLLKRIHGLANSNIPNVQTKRLELSDFTHTGSSWTFGESIMTCNTESTGTSVAQYFTTGNTYNDFVLDYDFWAGLDTTQVGALVGNSGSFYYATMSGGATPAGVAYFAGATTLLRSGSAVIQEVTNDTWHKAKLVKRGKMMSWFVDNTLYDTQYGFSLIGVTQCQIGFAVKAGASTAVYFKNVRLELFDSDTGEVQYDAGEPLENIRTRYLEEGQYAIHAGITTNYTAIGYEDGKLDLDTNDVLNINDTKDAVTGKDYVMIRSSKATGIGRTKSNRVIRQLDSINAEFIDDGSVLTREVATMIANRAVNSSDQATNSLELEIPVRPFLTVNDRLNLTDTTGISGVYRVIDHTKNYTIGSKFTSRVQIA